VAHYEEALPDPVLPQLPTHAGHPARAELLFDVTMPVEPGGFLVVTNVPRFGVPITPCLPEVEDDARLPSLAACNASGITGGPYRTDNSSTSTCNIQGFVNISEIRLLYNEEGFPYGLNMTVNHSHSWPMLDVGPVYRLRYWCRATIDMPNWSMETEDGQPWPTNTNDAQDEATLAAAEMTVQVTPFTTRSPQASLIRLDIRVRAGPDQGPVTILRVLMPEGFVLFDRGEPVGSLTGEGRPIVSVAATYGIGDVFADEGRSFQLEVLTPPSTPADKRWFVIAQTPGEIMTGWGMNPGFDVIPLPVRIAFPPIPLYKGWVVLAFTIPKVREGKYALVTAPSDFVITCPGDEPDDPPAVCEPFDNLRGEVEGVGILPNTVNVSLTMAGTPEGQNLIYAVILKLETPEVVQGGLGWNVRILNQNFRIVDAGIGIMGPTSGTVWNKDFFIDTPTLAWDAQPQGGENSVATIEVNFARRVPEVRAVLISLPERYRHDIPNAGMLESLNPYFPIAEELEQWQIYWNVRWVRILIAEPASEFVDFLPGGTYQFRLPIMVPPTMPANKEFYFSLCSDQACDDPDRGDPEQGGNILASFPIPNTVPVLPANEFTNLGRGATAGARRGCAPATGAAWLLLMLSTLAAAAWRPAAAAAATNAGDMAASWRGALRLAWLRRRGGDLRRRE